MSTTQTRVSHYEVQKKRRATALEEWRQRHRTIIKGSAVEMVETPRRMRRGVMVSADGDLPTVVMDAVVHEIDGGVTSTIHRHSWDAIVFVIEGSGWTEVDGERVNWRPWDTVYLPSMRWHRHGNPGDAPARFVSFSVQPQAELLGGAVLEEGGDTPWDQLAPAPVAAGTLEGSDPYSNRINRLAALQQRMAGTRLITPFEEVPFKVSPRGARSGFMVDPSIGYATSGLTSVMHQLAPGLYQSRHRHGGEAWLYVVEGRGHSEIDGVEHPWEAGDLVVVDHWAWHQHFNSDPSQLASLIRVHNQDTLYLAMRIMLDPLDLFEEPPKLDSPDLSSVVWPSTDAGRPSA